MGDGGEVMGVLNDEELFDEELRRLLLSPPLGEERGVDGGGRVGSSPILSVSRDGVEASCCCDAAIAAAAVAASTPLLLLLWTASVISDRVRISDNVRADNSW